MSLVGTHVKWLAGQAAATGLPGFPAGADPVGVWSAAARMRTHRAHRESGSWG
jgi:hypothetical protein